MIPTTKQIADMMISEIREDFAAGVLPASVVCFADLHDFVDANCYGKSERILETLDRSTPDTDEGHTEAMNQLCGILNPAIELVDAWLRNGGILHNFA